MITEENIRKLFKNRDYRIYWCRLNKRNYLTMGYFCGGAVNIQDLFDMAKEFHEATSYPMDSIHYDEVTESRFIKHFKVIYSNIANQESLPTALAVDSFWDHAK